MSLFDSAAGKKRAKPKLRLVVFVSFFSVAALAIVLLFTAIDREAPYKVVAKPLEGRIHFGKDEEAAVPPSAAP